MQLPKRLLVYTAAALIGLSAAYSGISGTKADFRTEIQCGQPDKYGNPPTNCFYYILKETKNSGTSGFGQLMRQEEYTDIDTDGIPDVYVDRIIFLDDPYRTFEGGNEFFYRFGSDELFRQPQMVIDGKGNVLVAPSIPRHYNRGSVIMSDIGFVSRVMTDQEERTIQNKFEEAVSHLPKDNPYRQAIGR